MNRSTVLHRPGTPMRTFLLIVGFLFLSTLWLYNHLINHDLPLLQATRFDGTEISFQYEIAGDDFEVDWNNHGDFDPRGKCPKDFFSAGFILICKRMKTGEYFKFLYHKGKRLLYRIDTDVLKSGKIQVGLHWVVSTYYTSKYRIADMSYKGGKTLSVPTAKGTRVNMTFHYGQAVSKKRIRPRRELFSETHINPQQCTSWWDIINFIP